MTKGQLMLLSAIGAIIFIIIIEYFLRQRCMFCEKKRWSRQFKKDSPVYPFCGITYGGICKKCVKTGNTTCKDHEGDFYVYNSEKNSLELIYREEVYNEPCELRFKTRIVRE